MSTLTNIELLNLVSGGASNPNVRSGTADPSAGGGVTAPEGSIYLRFVAAGGEFWVKTGTATAAWQLIASPTVGGALWSPIETVQMDTGPASTMTWSAVLDMDTDLAYRVDYIVGNNTAAAREVILLPNALTTNQISTSHGASTGVGFVNTTHPRLVIAETGGSSQDFLYGWVELFKLTTDITLFRSSSGQATPGVAGVNTSHALQSGIWNVTTNLTGLGIAIQDTADTLQADIIDGSWATLSRINRGPVTLI